MAPALQVSESGVELSATSPTVRAVGEDRLAPMLEALGRPWALRLGITTEALANAAGWGSLGDAEVTLAARHASAVGSNGDPRREAAALVPRTAGLPACAAVLPAVLHDVLPDLRLPLGRREILVHRHPAGWLDGVSLPAGTVGVPEPTPSEIACDVVALAQPIILLGSAQLPISERAAWGGVVDTLTGLVLACARAGLGADQHLAWARLKRVVDALGEWVPLAGRPRPFPVEWSGGPSLFPVRGTCCLYYRSQENPVRDGDGYCSTCPLRSDASRQQRIAAHLERAACTQDRDGGGKA